MSASSAAPVHGKVVRVRRAGRPVAVKRYPAHDTARFKCWGSGAGNEAAVAPLLGGLVPRTLSLRAGADGEVATLEWVDGRPLRTRDRAQLRAAGTALGRIHATAGGWFGSLDGRRRFASAAGAFRDRFGAAVRLLAACDGALAARVARWSRPRLDALAIAGPPALVHGDFGRANLLVAGDGTLRVLDWEHARWGEAQEDWAKLRLAARFPEPNGLGARLEEVAAGWTAVTRREPPADPAFEQLLACYLAICLGCFLDGAGGARLAWVAELCEEGR